MCACACGVAGMGAVAIGAARTFCIFHTQVSSRGKGSDVDDDVVHIFSLASGDDYYLLLSTAVLRVVHDRSPYM